MAVRPNRSWVLIPLVACLIVALAAPASSSAAGTDDPLGRRIVDVAFVPRGQGLNPDLLTVNATDDLPGHVDLALLRRGAGGWSDIGATHIDSLGGGDGAYVPTLVELGGGRYALVASSQSSPETVVRPFSLDPTANPVTFELGTPLALEGWYGYSGAADVDGDGVNELVVLSGTEGDDQGRCADTIVHVLSRDGLGLHPTDRRVKLKGVKAFFVSGAASGEFDGRRGADLLMHAYDTCGPDPEAVQQHHLAAIRLADASVILDIPSPSVESTNLVPSVPLVVDVDGDGRDEVVLTGTADLAVYDPSDHWKRLTLAYDVFPPVAFAATDGSTGGRQGTVSWVGRATGSGGGVVSARIGRVGGSLTRVDTQTAPFPDLGTDVLDGVIRQVRIIATSQAPPASWTGDVDGDGCPDWVLPGVIVGCAGQGPVRAGPNWLATRPLGMVDTPGGRRLLVAAGLEWYPYAESPYPPSPRASATDWWRSGSSPPFFMAEVPPPLDGAVPSVEAPVVPAFTDRTAAIDLAGPSDARVLLRVYPLSDLAAPPVSIATVDGLLRTDAAEGETTLIRRFPGPTGTGPTTSTLPFDIATEAAAQNSLDTDRWSVSAITLDAFGDPSTLTSQIVVHDKIAPSLSLQSLPVSPPWPFEARITGTSEPGATVRLGDGPPVTVGASGTFELPARLAPWPQSVDIVATDQSGNATPATISVMGGVDLRPFPWPAIAAVIIIIAVALSSLRGARRVHDIAPIAVAGEDGGDLIIEELDPGSTYRRD